MLRKLIYISNTRLPSEKANSYQSIQMCRSFSKTFDEVELWTGRARQTKELKKIKNIYEFYNIKNTFVIKFFFQYDSFILGNLNEFLWANLRDFIFSLNICFRLIKYRKEPSVVLFTRVWSMLYIFLFFKKIGLVNNKIYFESHKFSKFILKPLSELDGLIVINNYLFNSYQKHDLKNIYVAHDGVNIEDYNSLTEYKFKPKKNQYNLVYTGSLFQWKGVYALVDSLNYLANNINLICIGGSAQYLKAFQKYVKDSGQENRVTIIPHIPKKDLLEFIETADILLLPNSAKDKMSLYTSPIKMFEYMASKRPIVASDLSSIKEVLTHKKNAFLFEADNEKDLARKIKLVLNQDCSHLVNNAYEEVNKYTWDDRAKNIKKFIELSESYQ